MQLIILQMYNSFIFKILFTERAGFDLHAVKLHHEDFTLVPCQNYILYTNKSSN